MEPMLLSNIGSTYWLLFVTVPIDCMAGLSWGWQTPGRGLVPVREEFVTGPCRTKAKLVQK